MRVQKLSVLKFEMVRERGHALRLRLRAQPCVRVVHEEAYVDHACMVLEIMIRVKVCEMFVHVDSQVRVSMS